jgi:hypothetical protein
LFRIDRDLRIIRNQRWLKQSTTTSIIASIEATVRTVFKLFQRPSKFAFCKAVSSSEADAPIDYRNKYNKEI